MFIGAKGSSQHQTANSCAVCRSLHRGCLFNQKTVNITSEVKLKEETRVRGGGWQEKKASLVVKKCRYEILITFSYRILYLIFV